MSILNGISKRRRHDYSAFMVDTFDVAAPVISRSMELQEKQKTLKIEMEKLRSQPLAKLAQGSLPVIAHQDIAHTSLADS